MGSPSEDEPVIRAGGEADSGFGNRYEIAIWADGRVTCELEWGLAVEHAGVTPRKVRGLIAAFGACGFLTLPDRYEAMATCHGDSSLAFRHAKGTKSIWWDHSNHEVPSALRALERRIVRTLGLRSLLWVRQTLGA